MKSERAMPAELIVRAADVAMDRGDAAGALRLLEGAEDAAALLLAADIHAERGELGQALAYVERALARDIEAPGLRERALRWRQKLGGVETARDVAFQDRTLLQPSPPETSLRIVSEAGRGGAGVVYRALDDKLRRSVALKIYHRPDKERDKLEREARCAVELAGAGVVRIFDLNPEAGWLAMEWLGGGGLRVWLRERRDDLWPLEGWYPALVRAVARVHRAGLVHADVKPANVLFRRPNEPVLSDFGLAQRPNDLASGGSFGYLSPERLQHAPLTFSDDVYGLGRILEEVLGVRAELGLPELAGWSEMARLATAPRPNRPADAEELLRQIQGGCHGVQ
jgi:serine/threonine-protein kinase